MPGVAGLSVQKGPRDIESLVVKSPVSSVLT